MWHVVDAAEKKFYKKELDLFMINHLVEDIKRSDHAKVAVRAIITKDATVATVVIVVTIGTTMIIVVINVTALECTMERFAKYVADVVDTANAVLAKIDKDTTEQMSLALHAVPEIRIAESTDHIVSRIVRIILVVTP